MCANVLDINVKNYFEVERFELLRSINTPDEVIEYVKSLLRGLTIQILNEEAKDFMTLYNLGLLEGWNFRTTETAILFFNDDSYIERGNLKLNPYFKSYKHSWICFNYNNKVYVFDPAFRLIVKKEIYLHIFEATINVKLSAKRIKKEFIYRISNHISDEIPLNNFDKSETYIAGNEDINSSLYKTNTGYKGVIEEGKIINLVAHYYGFFPDK